MAKMALKNLKLMIRIMRNERTNDDNVNVNVNAKQLQEATTPGERSIHRPRTGEGDDAKDRNNSEGLFGAASAKGDGLVVRDGVTDLTGHWNTYGEEWQVNEFRSKALSGHRNVILSFPTLDPTQLRISGRLIFVIATILPKVTKWALRLQQMHVT